MMKTRKLLTLLLVLAMAFAVVPTLGITANAAAPTELTDGGRLYTGSYILNSDITLTEQITLMPQAKVTIDLNGHVLCYGSTNSNAIFNDGSGVLTVTDSSITKPVHYFTVQENGLWKWDDTNKDGATALDKLNGFPEKDDVIAISGGVITGGSGYFGGGIYCYGTNFLSDITICGNQAGGQGGGIAIGEEGYAQLTNVTICGNVAPNAGGMHNYNATAILTGCTIRNNSATLPNGGYGVGVGGIENNGGAVTLNASKILYNNSSYQNGGIGTSGTLILNDKTEIIGNVSKSEYPTGGLYAWCWGNSSVTINGKVTIRKNVTVNSEGIATPANLCLSGETAQQITIGELYDSTIGVSLLDNNNNEAPTTGAFSINGTADNVQYFYADQDEQHVEYAAGKLKLVAGGYACNVLSSVAADYFEQTLVLNGVSAGDFLITEKGNGFTLKSNGKYVMFDYATRSMIFTGDEARATVWKYDGGLYAEISSGNVRRAGFFRTARTVRYYLSVAYSGQLYARLLYTPAQVENVANLNFAPIEVTCKEFGSRMSVLSQCEFAVKAPEGANVAYKVSYGWNYGPTFTLPYKPASLIIRVTEGTGKDAVTTLWQAKLVRDAYVVSLLK